MKKINVFSHFYTSVFNNAEFESRAHLPLRIILVLSGTLEMRIGGKKYEISEGYGAFITSLVSHSFHSEKPNSFRLIEFSREHLDGVFSYVKGKKVINHIFRFSSVVRCSLGEYIDEKGFYEDERRINAVLAPLAYEIGAQCEFESASADSSMLLKILDYMEEHFNDDISLSSVGAVLRVHPVSVSRTISQNTGGTFNYCLRHIRCTYAAKQIIFGGMTVSEIAFDSGFGSIRSFNRAFLDVYGMTPKEYRAAFTKTPKKYK